MSSCGLPTKALRFPSPEEFVGRYVAATPLAAIVAKASADARAALITEVSAALKSFVDHQGLAFPIEAHLALARASLSTHARNFLPLSEAQPNLRFQRTRPSARR